MFLDDVLDQGAPSDYARMQGLFSDPGLRVSWRAQLRDERLISEGVELGDEVIIEKGAAILGRSRILRGKVEKAAIIVDCVIKDVIARAGSVLLGVEQLDDTAVIAESGQLLADVLIMELTFVAPSHRKERIHKFGHMHLDDVLDRRDRFSNKLIIAAHFSTRYHTRQIRHHVQKALPDMLGGRLHLWL